jgi:hypothetical protein
MFGIELSEIFLFLKQLGFALAGAAALWGMVMSRKDKHCGEKDCLVYDFISLRLLRLFSGGVALSLFAYLFLLEIFPVFAHEGIAIYPTITETIAGLISMGPLLLIALVLTIIALVAEKINPRVFAKYLTPFFAVQFVIFFILASIPALTGNFDGRQIFFIGHGFHSIFTLGSVLILDFLFLTSQRSPHLMQHIVPMFPTISKVIWAGFAFDLLSALFILPLVEITAKTVFIQTVVGVLLINGAILSGPIARKMIEAVMENKTLSGRWGKLGDICGTISISSWSTITLVDTFEHLTLPYPVLILAYLALIGILYTGHRFMSERERRLAPPVFIH